MRMQPITFRSTYSDYTGGEYDQNGFKHFSNEKESVLAMHVDLMVLPWCRGVYMHVNLLEEVVPKPREVGDVIHWDKPFERSVHKVDVYDYPDVHNTYAIRPTMEQVLLMHALHKGDLRGEFADRIANALYVDLIVLEPKSEFGKYLPDVKEFYENLVANGHWDRKTK